MKKALCFVIDALLLSFLVSLVSGCSKEECVVCPPDQPAAEKEYHFLYSFVGGFHSAWVYTYSTKTGKVVDSVYYGDYPFYDVQFSKDGKYAYYSTIEAGRTTWVTDWATGDTLAIVGPGIGGSNLSLTSDGRYLLVSRTPKLTLLELPSLRIVYEKTQPDSWGHAAVHPFKNVAYVPNPNPNTAGSVGEDSVMVLDFQSFPVRTFKFGVRSMMNGEPLHTGQAAISRDGRILIVLAQEPPPSIVHYIHLYDTETLELLREYSAAGLSWLTNPVVHPDGERVLFRWPSAFGYEEIGTIWVLSLKTFLMTRIFAEDDFIGSWPFFLNPSRSIEITPDGKYAFMVNAGHGLEYGPIVKLDMDSYKIVDAFYPPSGRSDLVRINPAEIK